MPRFNEKQFEAEQDMSTLKRADEIKKDPKRMKAASAMASRELEGLRKVAKAAPRRKGASKRRTP